MLRGTSLLLLMLALACGDDVVVMDASVDAFDASTEDTTVDDVATDVGDDTSGDVEMDANDDAGVPWEDVSALLEPMLEERGLVGLGAAVIDVDEGLIALGAAGHRRLGGDEMVTTMDRWHLGSDTKAMTATLAAMLVEDGLIDWDTTVTEVFPSFADSIDVSLREVTLVHLLTHRAGLEGEVTAELLPVWQRLQEMREPVTGERLWFAEQMLTREPAVEPGTAVLYANAGYMVAGAMLELVSGKSWETLMQERLFDPLEMASCGFGAPATAGMVDQPWGHSGSDPLTPVAPGPMADNPPALGPAGTVHCSLEDWGKFIALHLRGARGDTELLPASAFARLQEGPGFATPTGNDVAYGWVVSERPWAGGKVLFHTGSNTTFFANVWMAPLRGRAYLAVTNSAGMAAHLGTDAVVGAMVERFLPME